MVGVSVLCALPLIWMVGTSLRPSGLGATNPLSWPPSLANYATVVRSLHVGRLLANTMAVSVATTVAQLFVCLLAGYAMAVWDFPGRRLVLLAFLGVWLVPFQATMVPNYLLLNRLGLVNTLTGLIVPNMVSGLALVMLRQHLLSFPRDLIEAARMDGRSSWSILWRVVVPNLRPALAALAILLFITAWNDYQWPALVLQRADSVIQVGIRGFLGAEGDDWGAIMAASSLASLPTFGLFLFFRRRVTDAFIRSGLG